MGDLQCSLYLLDQVPGVSTEWRGRTLEALDPLYGVVNGEQELEHGITYQILTVLSQYLRELNM